MRVRGLKHELINNYLRGILSHPMRVRGLKHDVKIKVTHKRCRTPCGCVD